MGHFKKSLIGMILLVVLCISLFLLTSCGKDPVENPNPDTTVTDYGIDNDYFMMENGEEYRFTIIGNTFKFSLPSGEQTGTFTYADGALSLTCKGDGAKTASAVIADGVLTLTYDGGTYRMLQHDSYTVTFVNGENTLYTQKVLNGEYAVKPQDPALAGYAFIGWYADAAYQTVYAFGNARVTANTTIYARFEQLNGKPTYTAAFVGADETYAAMQTVNGVLYNLPTPADKADARFLGWWMSDYQDATRLTAQYTGQELTQDITLYAKYGTDDDLALSVTATGFSWNSLGVNLSYHIVVKSGAMTLLDTSSTAVRYDFDFAGKSAGDYTITVSANGKEAVGYYRNKALDRVANFRVVSQGLLVFDPVANAQEYIVTVQCGSANHKHIRVSNGTSTNFVFTSCEMPADGITFTVTAKADGYMDSTASYTYSLMLGDVRNIALEGGKTLTWSAVENAAGYVVSLSRDGITYESVYITSGTSYDLASMAAGDLFVKVKPVTTGYYAAEPAEAEHFTKTMLARPDGIMLSGSSLVWNEVEGAVDYIVTINGATYHTTAAALPLTKSILTDGVDTYEVTVQAIAETAADHSPVSAVVAVNYKTLSDVTYRDGYLHWSPVLDAAKYYVRVGDSAEMEVAATAVSAPISFTESGTIKVYVSYESESGERSDWVSTTVEVYEITLDVRGGKAVSNLYKAYGDSIELPETTRTGYTFAGWFLTPNSLENGKLYTATRHDERNDLVLYANWTANTYTITLVPGDMGDATDMTITVTYGKLNKVDVVKSNNSAYFFAGWYTGQNGTGIRYFDDKGEALVKWNSTEENLSLYAYYAESLSFMLIDGDAAYAVSKGPYGIGALTEITIPATHTGPDGIERPVTTIEGSAFIYCNTLKVINIPNTIESVNAGTDGGNSAGSCFQGCYQLTAVNVYEVEGAIAPKYFSQDGLLYCNEFGSVEVRYCPYAKTGLVTLCEGTTAIPAGTFRSTKVSEVQIPHTVATVGANAFYGSNFVKIVFLPTPEDQTPVELSMEEKAIYWCRELTEIKLPARIIDFTAKTIQSCNNLTSIDVEEGSFFYRAMGEEGRKVLCTGSGAELIFCPVGMAGTFEIPTGVETIRTAAFSGCSKLTKVIISGTVKKIEKEAFKGNSSITTVEFDEDGQPLTICESAFYSCTSLSSLTLPKNLIKLEKSAFGDTPQLTAVTVNTQGSGESPTVDFASGAFGTDKSIFYVTDITLGPDAPFFDVSAVFGKKLSNITVHEDNPYYASEDGILYDKAKTKIVFYPYERTGVCDLPETIVEIGGNVFNGRTGLTGITIGKEVTTVGDGAFDGCTGLEYIRFEDGGTEALTIGETAFKNCEILTEIVLPTRLKSIGAKAFMNCYDLASVTFPEGLETIGTSAFRNCRELTTVVLPSTLKQIDLLEEDSGLFAKDAGSCDLFTGCPLLETLTIAASNPNYCTIDNILYQKVAKTEGATPVPVKLLYCPQNKGGSTDVVVPDTVTEVAACAFFVNNKITSITFSDLPDGEEFIFGTSVFQGCDEALTSVKLPKGLKTIPAELFILCYKLEEITIPSTVESIESKAFSSCSNLERLIFAAPAAGETPVPLVIEDVKSYDKSPFNGCKKLTSITFPERMTVLGSYVFAGKQSEEGEAEIVPYIEQVSFPSTLERIGTNAFYNAKKLTSVTFAAGTKLTDGGSTPAIGDYAFNYCTSLTSLTLPAGDTEAPYTIGSNAFARTAITTLTIPAGVKEIKIYAFFWNDKLTELTFAEGANPKFGTNIFASCTALSQVTLPEGMTEISASMFYNCKALTEITIPSTVTKIGEEAFSSCAALATIRFTNYTVEAEDADPAAYSRIENIGKKAFAGTALTSFTFPKLESATKSITLGDSLFTGCKLLTDVTLTRSVAKIDGVFTGCASIRNLTVDPDNNYFASYPGDPILYSKDGKELTFIVGSLTGEYRVKDGVTKIGANVFENQYGITKLTLPASLMEIGADAFKKCAMLETIVFEHSTEAPSQLTTIGKEAFMNCYSLKSVTLPANLKTIGESMFKYCYALESIELPQGLETIGKESFLEAGLTSITIPASVKTISSGAFGGAISTVGKLQSVTFAKTADNKTALTKIDGDAFKYQALLSIEIPKTVTTLGTRIFYNCKSLTTASFESGTTIAKIPSSTFYGCESLTSIVLPSSITTIDGSAFSGCSALTSIELPAGLTTINSSAFNNCVLLETVTIPSTSVLTTISSSAFSGCESLTSIALPNTIKTIGSSAFKNCTSLTTFTFANGVKDLTKLDTSTFTGCTALTTIAIPDSVTSLGKTLFQGCTSLKTVTFGTNSALDTILQQCFEASGLTSISIPKGVTVLGTSKTAGTAASSAKQFLNCTELETVEFLGNLKLLGGYIFQGCTSLTSVTLPATVTQVGNYCFDGCSSLDTLTFTAGTAALTIGQYAFRNTALTSLTVPARTTKIDKYAFQDCAALTTLTFEAGTKALTLNEGAFQGCAELTTATLSDQVTAIPANAFYGCKKLATVTGAKVQTIGATAFRNCKALTTITLPDTLKSIGSDAFMGSGLTEVTIPAAVTSIDDNAFGACADLMKFTVAADNTTFETFAVTATETVLMEKATDGGLPTIIAAPARVTGDTFTMPNANLGGFALNAMLKNVMTLELPEGMTEIPNYAFIGASITSITLPSTLTKIGTGAFQSSDLTSIVIPADVTEIGGSAFKNCRSLETITFAEGSKLTTLGTYAFAESGLTAITLPAGVTNLYKAKSSSFTFQDCKSLASVEFLGEITELNGYAFDGCTALKSFIIPASVKSMGSYVFQGSGLESITIPKTLDHLYASSYSTTNASYTFKDCLSLRTVVIECRDKETVEVDGAQVEQYKTTFINGSAFVGCTALTSVTIPPSVSGIGANAFEGCTALTSVTFSDGAQANINTKAFKDCTLLSSVTFGEDMLLTTIAANAFEGCTSLASIEIPASVTSLGASLFKGCTALTSVTFAAGSKLADIGASAFEGTGITAIVLPTAAETLTLGKSLFMDCTQLASVSMGGNVITIPNSAFKNCTALKTFTIPTSVETISASAFEASGLTAITIPDTVTKCDSKLFYGCLSLETVVIGEGCTSINSSTFEGCTALSSVTLPDTLTYIGLSAFKGCTALTTLVIPETVTSLYGSVFSGWTAAQTIRIKGAKILSATWTYALSGGWYADCEATIVWNYTE